MISNSEETAEVPIEERIRKEDVEDMQCKEEIDLPMLEEAKD